MPTDLRAMLVPAIALSVAASGCRYRPTQVTLFLDTTVASARQASVTIVALDGDATIEALRARRATPQVTMRSSLPGSVTLVPREGAARSGAITVLATMTVAASAGQPATQVERFQRLRWIERTPQQSRIVFNARCSDRAVGCTSATGLECTVSRRCIEQGTTCGDSGECVAIELPTVIITPDIQLDANVASDVSAPPVADAFTGRPDAPICDQPITDASAINALSAGWTHACFIRAGALFCQGNNGNGQLGAPAGAASNAPVRVGSGQRWIAVAAGESSTCAVDELGAVWCWGRNHLGQLGAGDSADRAAPARVAGLCGVRRISGGFNTFCAVDGNGALWCWGDNNEGQLSDEAGAVTTSATPLRLGAAHAWRSVGVGQGHTCAVREAGTMHCWGRNLRGELGLGEGSPMQVRAPAQVGVASDWDQVSAGQNSTCATRRGAGTSVWGDNDGWAPPILFTPQVVPFVSDAHCSVNTFHWCALDATGRPWCSGRNVEGQLGDGTTMTRTTIARLDSAEPFARIAVGRFFTCAQTAAGAVYCTGENVEGQLGLGDNTRRNTLTRVP